MPKPTYPWKRFWYPRSADFRLTDGGYLSDPDGEHGSILNPDALSFDRICGIPCLVLLGEPGIGKSTAVQSSQATLQFDLGAYQTDISLTNAIFVSAEMQAWSQGNAIQTLALDSLDEGRLAISNIVKVLLRELKQIDVCRLRLRIACRTADWPPILEDGLRTLWGDQNVSVCQLAPLRRQDVAIAAETHKIDPSAFFKEVDQREAVPFAIKPVTLEFLLTCFKRRQRFPATKTALYLEGCRGLCEPSDARRAAGWQGKLSADMRLGIAARIAALTILGGFSGVWNAVDRGDVPEGDLALRRICGGTERVNDIEIAVDEDAISEVLDTGLFASSGANTLSWSHHTYAEFLAAHYIAQHKFSDAQVLSIFTIPDETEGKIAPQLHEAAAWLASMCPEFFRTVMVSDPSVLLLSDVATADLADREALVETLLKLYDEEKLLDSDWGLRSLYRKLAHPKLDGQLRPYITDAKKGQVVRRVAIDIAEACHLQDLQTELASVALDSSDDVPTRIQAAYAVRRIGDADTKRQLKPLGLAYLPEDVQDELKGCALAATWPDLLSSDDLFGSLAAPRNQSFGGAYSHFLATILITSLEPKHLPAALQWLTRQPTRRELITWFEKLSDGIMDLAWIHLENPGLLDPFIDVVVTRLRAHDAILGSSDATARDVLSSDAKKRHLVVKGLVERLSEDELAFIAWSIPILRESAEFLWLVERYKQCADHRLRTKWLVLLVRVFNPTDQIQLEAILVEVGEDSAIAAAVSPLINPVDIASQEAQRQREAYERHQQLEVEMRALRDRPLPSPPPAERVEVLLQRFEGGDLAAWVRLLRELTLGPRDTQYEVFEEHIGDLPGWNAANAETRARLLAAARTYVLGGEPATDAWLGQNIWDRGAVAGARALQLLLLELPDSLQGFDHAVWNKWAASLLVFPAIGKQDFLQTNRELLRLAYEHVPDEVIRAVLVLINAANERSQPLAVIDLLEGCLDAQLAEALHAKCHDRNLNAQIIISLVTAMLEHGYTPAHALALSFVPTPVPGDGSERELAIGIARALLRLAPTAGWSSVWVAFQADTEFGKAVISHIDCHGSRLASLLNEEHLADLYLWLVGAEPEATDEPLITRPHDYASMWRNDILQALQSRGTDKACQAILRLMRERPEQTFLKWSLQSAREITRMRNWKPVEPEFVLQMPRDSRKRLVRSGDELLRAILESLESLAKKLRGETPLVANLWDEVTRGVWQPKDEDHFSDNVKQHLDDDLRARGVVLNREVQIRRNRGSTKGERTDIHVDAVIPRTLGNLDVITVIIEVKGCWNEGLWTSMETQLVGRYLHETHARHGIYLVGWFNCPQWNKKDRRKPPKHTLPEAQNRLNEQAYQLSTGRIVIKAVVLDTSLR